MRLLLVEDDPRIARFVAKGLREQAYAVDVANTGENALYQAAVNTYDLVILDVMIPAPDGFAVCRELRKSGQRVVIDGTCASACTLVLGVIPHDRICVTSRAP